MPVHDWTRVDAGIFHDFHSTWIVAIKTALNDGILPAEYYALAEQIVGPFGPNVVALQRPAGPSHFTPSPGGVVTLKSTPPRTRYHFRVQQEAYARKAKAIKIRHRSDHRVIALVEVVSPGNKESKHGLRSFLRKADEALEGGVHLLILDLIPPGPRDPQGLHLLIRGDRCDPIDPEDEPYSFDPGKPLSLMSYVAAPGSEAFIEPIAVGDELPPMPLFLTTDEYVNVPLGPTYEAAWRALPAFWRDVLSPPKPGA